MKDTRVETANEGMISSYIRYYKQRQGITKNDMESVTLTTIFNLEAFVSVIL
jgi:hypothetical protein